MKIEVNLPDRLYEEIRELCEYNNQTIDGYIVDCISDTYYTLKYGDLNLKISKDKEDLKTDEKIVEKTEKKPDVEKKKVGRPRKKVEEAAKTEITEKPMIEETVLNNTKNTVLKKEETINIIDEQLQNKIKRTKRVLKVK